MNTVSNKNIILIGFMGSGKTSIGQRLSKKTSFDFYDTDHLIKESLGTTINHIFSEYGEEYFRTLETNLLKDLGKNLEKSVVSTGGGIILKEENINLLKDMGTIIYLKASPDTIIERLKDDKTRPLLQGRDRVEKIKSILDIREPIYEGAANIIIDTDGKTFKKIIEMIIAQSELSE